MRAAREPNGALTTVSIRVRRLGDTRQRVMMALGARRFRRVLQENLSNLAALLGGGGERTDAPQP